MWYEINKKFLPLYFLISKEKCARSIEKNFGMGRGSKFTLK